MRGGPRPRAVFCGAWIGDVRLSAKGAVVGAAGAGSSSAGAVESALGLRSFVIGPEIAPGVPALQSKGELRLVLKSGNFGGQDFYRDALSVLYAPLR